MQQDLDTYGEMTEAMILKMKIFHYSRKWVPVSKVFTLWRGTWVSWWTTG